VRVFTFACLMLLPWRTAEGYSVLTHEQLVDLSWRSTIVPILQQRFPGITAAQLTRAHAFAYGGCAIQDIGYYPFGHEFFSDLTHYVRSGDFVRNLFRNAQTPDELAFAIGALAHYIGDIVGHSVAVNPSVAIYFPKLRAKYGPSVNYAQDKHAHVQIEFAFDVSQIAKLRAAPAAYLRSVGLQVPRNQLTRAFYETYGLDLPEVAGTYRSVLKSYRFGVRSFLPAIAYAEALLHHSRFPADGTGPEVDTYKQRVAELARDAGWDRYRRTTPSFGTYLLAGLIVILPKIGPLALLSIKGPNAETELLYIKSVNTSTAALKLRATELATRSARGPGEVSSDDLAAVLPDRDLDTGARVRPGGYPLTDKTYAKLLAKITKNPARPIPTGLKQNIFSYYADPSAPISTRRDAKKWAAVQQQLETLRTFPERAEPE
jgi:hypothetical protein